MKHEYAESKRINAMPYIQFDQSKETGTHYRIHFDLAGIKRNEIIYSLFLIVKNIGKGTAKEIKYKCGEDNIDFKFLPVRGIQSGDSYCLLIDFHIPVTSNCKHDAIFELQYIDLLDDIYGKT